MCRYYQNRCKCGHVDPGIPKHCDLWEEYKHYDGQYPPCAKFPERDCTNRYCKECSIIRNHDRTAAKKEMKERSSRGHYERSRLAQSVEMSQPPALPRGDDSDFRYLQKAVHENAQLDHKAMRTEQWMSRLSLEQQEQERQLEEQYHEQMERDLEEELAKDREEWEKERSAAESSRRGGSGGSGSGGATGTGY